jgi:hypothetical protein
MTTRTITSTILLAGAALAAAACGGSDGADPTAPIPTNAPVTPVTVEDATSTPSTPSSTEAAAATTTSTSDLTGTTLNPSSSSVPPQTTDLLESFGIPRADLDTGADDPDNNRIIKPEDEPIIDAYLTAGEAQLTAFSTWPLDASDPTLLDAPFTAEALEGLAGGITYRTEQNQVLDISQGVTPRPYVIEDDDGDPDRAIVWDCQIDASFWKDADTGEKAPPESSYPNAGAPGVELGTAGLMVRVDGVWLAATGSLEPRACA